MSSSDKEIADVPFGYYPRTLSLDVGPVHIRTLPSLAEKVEDLEGNPGLHNQWIYAPPQQTRNFGGETSTLPFLSRVFGLPKTHSLLHDAPDSPAHVHFHIWVLSLLTGMRLTPTEAGFVDATPIKPGLLVDFVLLGNSLEAGIALAEQFWIENRQTPEQTSRLEAAIHALFLAHYPQALQYERFIYLYTALDACFALASAKWPPTSRLTHASRIEWMCARFGMPVPEWASTSQGTEVANIRNPTLHEGLYLGAPLGFALHGVGSNKNLTLEMGGLVCRFLIALLGGSGADYVRSAVNTRQRIGLRLT